MKKLDKLSIPLIQGGMGVGISMGRLAGAVAKEGAMGIISTANIGFRQEDFWKHPREADKKALAQEISKARELSQGNGLIGINAMVATTNFAEMVQLACENDIDAVIAGAGLPLDLPEIVEGRDVLIAPIVSSGRAAAMIIKVWNKRYNRRPDFIVVEGSNAGGHLGFSREELENHEEKDLDEILKDVIDVAKDIPVFAAGGVFDAEDIKRVRSAKAYGVQIATRFIATEECDATQEYKDVLLKAHSDDVVILKSPVGMPGRGFRTPLIKRIEEGGRVIPSQCIGCIHGCDPKTTPYCINKALIEAYYGNYDEGLFFSGANAERVNEMSTVHDLIKELKKGWDD